MADSRIPPPSFSQTITATTSISTLPYLTSPHNSITIQFHLGDDVRAGTFAWRGVRRVASHNSLVDKVQIPIESVHLSVRTPVPVCYKVQEPSLFNRIGFFHPWRRPILPCFPSSVCPADRRLLSVPLQKSKTSLQQNACRNPGRPISLPTAGPCKSWTHSFPMTNLLALRIAGP